MVFLDGKAKDCIDVHVSCFLPRPEETCFLILFLGGEETDRSQNALSKHQTACSLDAVGIEYRRRRGLADRR